MKQLSDVLRSQESVESYRKEAKDFTRKRKLTFSNVACLIIQKSVKSLQLKLNEFIDPIKEKPISASSFTQARAKLSYKLFKDINHKIYSEGYYDDESFRRYKGHRLLAVDGSKLRLPDTEEMQLKFGKIRLKNQHGTGDYTGGLCSVLYDLLNDLVVDGILSASSTSERFLAKEHLNYSRSNDLILLDRGYPSYALFAEIEGLNADFVCRCAKNAFNVVKEFLREDKVFDKVVEITPSKDLVSEELPKKFQKSMQVRLVKVILKTGEIEVLMTSLLNKRKYTKSDFKNLYAKRWSVETLYDRIKNRLCLENFTGKTVEAINQDFYSTLLLTNLESDITSSVNKKLKRSDADNKYKYKVNKSVSFNTIKNYAFDLFFGSEKDIDTILRKLESLFLTNTIPIRESRNYTRDKTTHRRTANFAKYAKKHVF